MIKTALIVAVAQNNVIGIDNGLPWHIPEELKYFKAKTMGKPLIMGRLTYESIVQGLGKPLPGRASIVVTGNHHYSPPHADYTVSVEHSIGNAIAHGKDRAEALNTDELMIIGGANIYRSTLPLVDRIYRTLVHLNPEGDAFFQPLESNSWQLISSEKHSASKTHNASKKHNSEITYEYQIFDRINI